MILFLDTTDFNLIKLALIDKTNITEHVFSISYNENYKTLDFIAKFLEKHLPTGQAGKVLSTQYSVLNKIIVCSGPGSFTGTRVGITIAQALGFSWNIPVSAIPKNKIPEDLIRLGSIKTSPKLAVAYTPSKFD
jgi:tRNA threonylcarbamoyladenosine biosynthesis protein TsaB